MASYRFLVQKLCEFFVGREFLHVSCAENEAADTLAKIASSRQSIPPGVSLEHLHKPSVKPSPNSESIYIPDNPAGIFPSLAASQPGPGTTKPGPGTAEPDQGTAEPSPGTEAVDPAAVILDPAAAIPNPGAAAPEPALVAVFAVVTAASWALPISEFLENGVLPMDETEAREVQRRASAYSIINNKLVRRGSTGVFQRCVEQDQGVEILLDIHQDTELLVLKCEGCQRFSKRNHQPASALRTIPIAWPFAVWGLDMVGPFKTARGGMTHLLVAVDKFTK
ncbi:uncharacterized protein [Aegilops tauschii subsp. strangulata]|uniref:uncharacterized protein n=1 Tax=Aegilops tauschii subsp. strangulata TaxID=200361 RepID=UPI00098BB1A8|nr:uncharacterized protein LOC109781769 [Aegilops tauschii subsp. strangulata]